MEDFLLALCTVQNIILFSPLLTAKGKEKVDTLRKVKILHTAQNNVIIFGLPDVVGLRAQS